MTASPPVVVGVDGSDSSRQALLWAVEEATRRRLRVELLCAWDGDHGAESVAREDRRMEDECRSVVDTAAAHARTASPRLDVSTSTLHAQPASALIAASRHADTVVVGSRGIGGLAEALLGSTSMQLAAYASCPVVVVRRPLASDGSPPRRVVVGVDGSALSTEAIGYAFEQASQRGLDLTVLHTWNDTVDTSGVGLRGLVEPWELVAEQELISSGPVARWTEAFPDVDVQPHVRRGRAADVLVNASASAELVVVGSRGRGGFRGLLLGSVSRSVLHRAQCPVAVVRPFSADDFDAPRPPPNQGTVC
jgi:nucleotide-binding universal stress UspA family protein